MAELVALADIDFTKRFAQLRERLKDHAKNLKDLEETMYVAQ